MTDNEKSELFICEGVLLTVALIGRGEGLPLLLPPLFSVGVENISSVPEYPPELMETSAPAGLGEAEEPDGEGDALLSSALKGAGDALLSCTLTGGDKAFNPAKDTGACETEGATVAVTAPIWDALVDGEVKLFNAIGRGDQLEDPLGDGDAVDLLSVLAGIALCIVGDPRGEGDAEDVGGANDKDPVRAEGAGAMDDVGEAVVSPVVVEESSVLAVGASVGAGVTIARFTPDKSTLKDPLPPP